jgi:Protein of unknown function (DUF3080)
MPRQHIRLCRLTALACLLLSSACSDTGPERPLERYIARLERTLQSEASVPLPQMLAAPPRPGSSRINVPGDSLDTLDFLALHGCAVQVTIGKMNSSLGRVASDSQRLLLALEYLQLAPECIASLKSKSKHSLSLQLSDAMNSKQLQLPAMIFNATLASLEYRQLWLPYRAPDYPAQTSSEVPASLQAITVLAQRWLSGDYQFDNQHFEILLSEVAKGDGGLLSQSLALQSAYLETANSLLHRRNETGALCRPGFRDDAANILDNVVRRYFIGDIQPWSAALERRRLALLPPIQALERQLNTVLPRNYRHWQQTRDKALEDWALAPREHVAQLKVLLDPCRN